MHVFAQLLQEMVWQERKTRLPPAFACAVNQLLPWPVAENVDDCPITIHFAGICDNRPGCTCQKRSSNRVVAN